MFASGVVNGTAITGSSCITQHTINNINNAINALNIAWVWISFSIDWGVVDIRSFSSVYLRTSLKNTVSIFTYATSTDSLLYF